MLAAVSLNNYPIPGGEAEGNAENNYMWEDAVKVAKKHRAHLMVAVLGKEENLLEKGKLFTKVVAACCRQEYAARNMPPASTPAAWCLSPGSMRALPT